MKKLTLIFKLSPGDLMTGTTAIYNLHLSFPNDYITKVKASVPAIFENNPFVFDFPDNETDLMIEMHYPTIHNSDTGAHMFINGYTEYLEMVLNKRLRRFANKPMVFLTDEEKNKKFVDGPYALVNAGVKLDYPIKQWPVEYYQSVVNATRGLVNWVQVGSPEHRHHKLNNVIDMIGKTESVRDFFSLTYNCIFGLGPITFLTHACAAFDKPYICIIGGREPVQWVAYPKQYTLHTIGQFDCCLNDACWKNKVVDGGDRNCKYPILNFLEPVAKCMSSITPDLVISIVKRLANANFG